MVHIIIKNVTTSESTSTKNISSKKIQHYQVFQAFHLQQSNQKQILMLAVNHQQLYHLFVRFYDYQCNISRWKVEDEDQDNYTTHWLSLTSIRNKLYCRSKGTDSFITHFFSLIAIGDKLQCIKNYQQYYYTFFDSCSSQKQTLTLHRFVNPSFSANPL